MCKVTQVFALSALSIGFNSVHILELVSVFISRSIIHADNIPNPIHIFPTAPEPVRIPVIEVIRKTPNIMTRHMVNHLNYTNDTSLEYRHPSRLLTVPPAPNDRSFSLARSNPRADPMARQPSRPSPAPHVAGSNTAGVPRRRIPVAVCSSLSPLKYCTRLLFSLLDSFLYVTKVFILFYLSSS